MSDYSISADISFNFSLFLWNNMKLLAFHVKNLEWNLRNQHPSPNHLNRMHINSKKKIQSEINERSVFFSMVLVVANCL